MELPCDGDGACMSCKSTPTAEETLTCYTCATPWHLSCLSSSSRPATMADVASWLCPDCASPDVSSSAAAAVPSSDLVSAVRAIQADASLSDAEKARRRQQLMSNTTDTEEETVSAATAAASSSNKNDLLDLIGTTLNCSICMQLPERPVTTPCGHNFCLKCFEKWTGQGKRSCANCRSAIPQKVATNPRINSALVFAIRAARAAKTSSHSGQPKAYHFVHNQNRPDTCFTTERAKKSGKANACSGKIFVTIPSDHFGPILPDYDPHRNQGVLVGESWADRLECRQWGAHFPHVAGLAGQSKVGSQSVALSGGYEDDEDHGDWFLYTGSGGRDLSGNKRTNNIHSFDQKFEKLNQALRISCLKGYPVRVVRSHKEKRSAYAPEAGVRYDGCYRIEKCWRKEGKQGFKMCRYLFVRCDNEPAPWTANDHGDRPRPLPVIKELKNAHDVTERKSDPHWDYDEEKECWCWKKPPPTSMKPIQTEHIEEDGSVVIKRRRAQTVSARERLLKEFSCNICREVMSLPITTPCAHNFCKACLDKVFAGQSLLKQRNCEGRRTLRAQKNIMKCPSCSIDIAEFLQNPQVNRELMNVIESLKQSEEDDNVEENDDADDAKQEADMSDEDDKEGLEISDEQPTNAEEEAKADTEVDVQEAATPKSCTISAVNRASKEETEPVDENAKDDALKTDTEVDGNVTKPADEKVQKKSKGRQSQKEEAKADTEVDGDVAKPIDEKVQKESKGRQNQKRKKAAETSPSGTVGAMTRGKRARAQ